MRRLLAGIVLSGAPSTAWTLLRGGDVLESTRVAGTMLGRPTVVRGLAAHVAISTFWWFVLRRWRLGTTGGAVAGVAIAALDLRVVAPRWFPEVAALPPWPQVADHALFGALVSRSR